MGTLQIFNNHDADDCRFCDTLFLQSMIKMVKNPVETFEEELQLHMKTVCQKVRTIRGFCGCPEIVCVGRVSFFSFQPEF